MKRTGIRAGEQADGTSNLELFPPPLPEQPNYPDGLTTTVVDALIERAYAEAIAAPQPSAALLDGSAAARRERREARRVISAVVRALPHRAAHVVPDGEVA